MGGVDVERDGMMEVEGAGARGGGGGGGGDSKAEGKVMDAAGTNESNVTGNSSGVGASDAAVVDGGRTATELKHSVEGKVSSSLSSPPSVPASSSASLKQQGGGMQQASLPVEEIAALGINPDGNGGGGGGGGGSTYAKPLLPGEQYARTQRLASVLAEGQVDAHSLDRPRGRSERGGRGEEVSRGKS